MSNPLAQAHDHLPGSDRRVHSRQPIRTLAYVELDEGNGGIVLNISEGGLSVQAFASLMDDVLPSVRFQLSESDEWIRANARITWTGESRKLAGLEFVDLPDDARGQIKEWLIREALPPGAASETSATSKVSEVSAAVRDTHEGALSTAPAPEPALAAENQGLDDVATAEFGTPIHGALVSEAVGSSAADVCAPISGHAHAVESTLGGEPADAKPLVVEKLIANRFAAVAVLLVLAVASLAAGWSAGQGEMGKFVRRFHAMPLLNGTDDRDATPTSTIPAARISEIEVVSASGQRRTIPFNGSLDNPTDAARPQAYGNTSSQARKPQPGFRTWILVPPQQTRAAADDSGLARENPPAMADAPGGTESVLTSSGAINPHALAGPPSLRVPDPPPPSGVVKQGQLVRRVNPEYPVIARDQHSEGTVRLNVTVGADGVVRGIAVLGGPRLLLDAAENAVRQWRYTPTTLDGKPVEFQREVDLTFHLSTPSH
jgi:TonB family protein